RVVAALRAELELSGGGAVLEGDVGCGPGTVRLAIRDPAAVKRTRIDEILVAEGLRWRKQETWFGERVDPGFAAKRGRSSGSTPTCPKGWPSSASARWGRKGRR